MNILPLLALQTIYYVNKHRRDSMVDERVKRNKHTFGGVIDEDYEWDDDDDYDWDDDDDYDWDDDDDYDWDD